MLEKIIGFSIRNKLIVVLFTLIVAAFGLYAVLHIPVGAVPDITNNQVQVITTSGNLSTQEIEQFITAPVVAPVKVTVGTVTSLVSAMLFEVAVQPFGMVTVTE